MKVFIRTDSSLNIGSGHVIRCLTLAQGLSSRGADVQFICRELDGNYIEQIKNKGFLVHSQPKKSFRFDEAVDLYKKWLTVPWEFDAEETYGILNRKKPDWLIVDHYGLDARWEKRLRKLMKHIMVIDDLANRDHDCDLLLDQNYYSSPGERYAGKVPSYCKKLLGPRYALVRPEFCNVTAHDHSGKIQKILIFFGASDNTNETERTLLALGKIDSGLIQINVVVGNINRNREKIKKMCLNMKNVVYHCQTEKMFDLMRESDLFIGAGGTTTWERCLMGLPSITIAVAENQYETSESLGERGACIFLGNSEESTPEKIVQSIQFLMNSPSHVLQMSRRAIEIMGIDNYTRGTHAVVQTMIDINNNVRA